MRTPQGFDYNQPSRDALAGVYVEVSDASPEAFIAESAASQEQPVVITQMQQLFGLTVSVVDDNPSGQRGRVPRA